MTADSRPRRLGNLVPKLLAGAAISVIAGAGTTGVAGAHADADVIAVPAGEQVTVNLRPNHGCGDSPTIEVAIRAPLEGAVAGEVEGWNATAEDNGQGQTVLEWTGGSLPTDVTGAFPVTFTAPDSVGELLLFPAVQVCENGEELAWISGDPEDEYPVPRLLILPAGSMPAVSIEDVPEGTPGRELLTADVDVTATTAPATTQTTAPTDGETSSPTASSSTSSTGPDAVDEPSEAVDESADDGGLPLAVPVAVVAVIVAGGGFAVWKRRS